MKSLTPRLFFGPCRQLGTLARVACWLLGVSLALPAWSTLTVNAADGTVADSDTGLEWDQCTLGLGGPTCATGSPTAFPWADAHTASAMANAAAYKGFRDWRLPNLKELESIVKIDSSSPAIDNAAFPATGGNYWTSSNTSPSWFAWFINFGNGGYYANTKTLTFYVRLVRSGLSLASFDSLASTTLPPAPVIGVANAGDAQASVAFSEVVGSAVTGYTVTSSPGGFTSGNCVSTPCAVTGLTNGTAYTFTVAAFNSSGTGPASAASNSVVPKFGQTIAFGFPAPTVVVGGTGTVSATASSGLTPVFFSVLPTSPIRCSVTPVTVNSAIVTGISQGICALYADQAGNASTFPAQAVSLLTIGPATPPSAPINVSVVPGPGRATLMFSPPTSTGGAPIVSYTAKCTASGQTDRNATGAGSPLSVYGLTPGVAYFCSVSASNGTSTGASSSALAVTPGKVIDITPILMLLLLDDNPRPTVTDITPTTATVSVATSFAVTGQNLPTTGLTLAMTGAGSICAAPTGMSSTGFTAACTPGAGTGGTSQTVTVMNGGSAIGVGVTVAVGAASRYRQVGIYPITSCVKDNLTGLTWEGKETSGLRGYLNLYTNFDSVNGAQNYNGTAFAVTQAQIDAASNSIGYAAYVNSIALCGYANWRLPTQSELMTLVDTGVGGAPYIDHAWFPNTRIWWYWSSTPNSVYSYTAVMINFGTVDSWLIVANGFRSNYNPNYAGTVRLVR